MVIGIDIASEIFTSNIIGFLKNTRDYLIANQDVGLDIAQISKILPVFTKAIINEESRDSTPTNKNQEKCQ